MMRFSTRALDQVICWYPGDIFTLLASISFCVTDYFPTGWHLSWNLRPRFQTCHSCWSNALCTLRQIMSRHYQMFPHRWEQILQPVKRKSLVLLICDHLENVEICWYPGGISSSVQELGVLLPYRTFLVAVCHKCFPCSLSICVAFVTEFGTSFPNM